MLDGGATFEFRPVDIRGYGGAVLGEARDYVDLVMALRAQAERLGVPQLEIDAAAGVASGFSGHCLVPTQLLPRSDHAAGTTSMIADAASISGPSRRTRVRLRFPIRCSARSLQPTTECMRSKQ
jgi:hypothetical protein